MTGLIRRGGSSLVNGTKSVGDMLRVRIVRAFDPILNGEMSRNDYVVDRHDSLVLKDKPVLGNALDTAQKVGHSVSVGGGSNSLFETGLFWKWVTWADGQSSVKASRPVMTSSEGGDISLDQHAPFGVDEAASNGVMADDHMMLIPDPDKPSFFKSKGEDDHQREASFYGIYSCCQRRRDTLYNLDRSDLNPKSVESVFSQPDYLFHGKSLVLSSGVSDYDAQVAAIFREDYGAVQSAVSGVDASFFALQDAASVQAVTAAAAA